MTPLSSPFPSWPATSSFTPFAPSTSTRPRTLPFYIPANHRPTPRATPSPNSLGTYLPRPPLDGSCPLLRLPDELLLLILSHLPLSDLLLLRLVSPAFTTLSLSPTLHRTLTLHTLPPHPLPTQLVSHILPSVRHLHLHLFPCPPATAVLLAMLGAISDDQLISLSIPFASPYLSQAGLGPVLARIGGRVEHLDLRGSGLSGPSWNQYLTEIGSRGRGILTLDLGYTSITSIPPLTSLSNLQTISLSSCVHLPTSVITEFLTALPRTVTRIDLSRLAQLPLTSLRSMAVASSSAPSAMREVRLVGIDHLTRVDVRRLKSHWEDQRAPFFPASPEPRFVPLPPREPKTPEPRTGTTFLPTPPQTPEYVSRILTACRAVPEVFGDLPVTLPTPPTPIERVKRPGVDDGRVIRIVHSAILESEDEAGYRQFIGEVVGGTLGLNVDHSWEEVEM